MFYVYELSGPDGKVFYVGKATKAHKGSRDRLYRHRKEHDAAKNRHLKVYRKIRSLWAAGQDYVEQIVFETDEETKAFEEERRRIALYGRENLCNLTDGGDGSTGYKHTPESRAKMSEKLKGRSCPEHLKAQRREAYKGRFMGQKLQRGADHWTHRRPEDVNKGEACHQALVTQEIAEAIRREYVPRRVPLRVFVERYGLKKSAVHKIIKGQSWK